MPTSTTSSARSSAGYSPGDRDEPFANFYFGGFGNNWVDHREEKRYREQYSFPGVELNEIAGTNYVRSMFEWNLPPVRFRRVGSPGFYLTWARPALFATALVTNADDSPGSDLPAAICRAANRGSPPE